MKKKFIIIMFLLLITGLFADENNDSKRELGDLINNLIDVGVQLAPPFSEGEWVCLPEYFLNVIEVNRHGNKYIYFVRINDDSSDVYMHPFYIVTNRKIKIITYEYKNVIKEKLIIKYKSSAEYQFRRIVKETLLFVEK